MEEYDIVLIGAGPGGYVAALHAAHLGFKTACIDKGESLGGTCLNVGCIPSKALLQSSEHLAFMREKAKEHGIEIQALSLNFPQMMARKKEIVQSLVQGIAGLFQRGKVTSIRGAARFVSPNELAIGDQKIRAKNIIIATGSEPVALPFMPFDEKTIISSTGALSLPKIPKDMLVIGAGVIGVELASVYQRLGAKVTLVEMLDHICPAMDGQVSKGLLAILKKQGLTFHLAAKVKSAEIKPSGVELTVEHENKNLNLSAECALVAVGRRPYTKDLGLKEIGIETDPKGFIPVDGNFRTVHPHIYAIGDVVEGAMLAHRASDEGVVVVDLIAGKSAQINYLAIPNVIYTHPEVAALGFTEEEAKALKIEIATGMAYFKANPRARCSGDTEGFVKVIGEKKSGRLIGMHIMGPHASEMIGEGVIAIEKGMTLKELAYASHAHPTLSESIKEAAQNSLGA